MMTLGNGAVEEIITKAQESLRVYEDLLKTQYYFGGKFIHLHCCVIHGFTQGFIVCYV